MDKNLHGMCNICKWISELTEINSPNEMKKATFENHKNTENLWKKKIEKFPGKQMCRLET